MQSNFLTDSRLPGVPRRWERFTADRPDGIIINLKFVTMADRYLKGLFRRATEGGRANRVKRESSPGGGEGVAIEKDGWPDC